MGETRCFSKRLFRDIGWLDGEIQIMKTDWKKMSMAVLLVLLLSLLGAALVATYAAPMENSGLSEPAAAEQDCYTLDTSRPEWLAYYVYLPVILKSSG